MELNYIVKVFVGGTTDIASIGLSSGVCTWAVGDQTLSVLGEKWCNNITDSVDVSNSGQYAKYTDITLNINKSALVETLLRNEGIILKGKRVEKLMSPRKVASAISAGFDAAKSFEREYCKNESASWTGDFC